MRVRNRKGAAEHLESNAHVVVENPADFKGRWAERFGNDHPIHIEVGCGKGGFITEWLPKTQRLIILRLICNCPSYLTL